MSYQPPVHPVRTPPSDPTHVITVNMDISDPTSVQPTHSRQRSDVILLPQLPVLETIYVASKATIRRLVSTGHRLVTEIREAAIGNGSFSVKFNSVPLEDSCYLEYIAVNQCWRASVCPSGIPLRPVEDTELTPGCRQLSNIAGCVFKTSQSTTEKDCKPIEIPSSSLRCAMRGVGFCEVGSGTLYRIFRARLGRRIDCIVTIVPQVEFDGSNQRAQVYVAEDALMTKLEVLRNECVAAVSHRLKTQDRNYRITRNGRIEIKRKLKGKCSIVLE